MSTSASQEKLVFDYRTLRLIVGAIAFLLPWVDIWLAGKVSSSISEFYHTNARDVFVGSLFVIGILLVAYKGHPTKINPGAQGPLGSLLNRFWSVFDGNGKNEWPWTLP